jgi:hypothetical protein
MDRQRNNISIYDIFFFCSTDWSKEKLVAEQEKRRDVRHYYYTSEKPNKPPQKNTGKNRKGCESYDLS